MVGKSRSSQMTILTKNLSDLFPSSHPRCDSLNPNYLPISHVDSCNDL